MTLKIPEIPRIQGTIHMGDTFYLVLALYDDNENTKLTDLTDMTPTGKLMSITGADVADFSCAYLEATATLPKRVAITLPDETTTAVLVHDREYLGTLDLVDAGGASYRKAILELKAERV